MQSKFVLWCMYNSYDHKFNNNVKYVPKITCLKSKAIIVFLVLKNKCKISTSEFLYIFLNLHTSNQIHLTFLYLRLGNICSRKNYIVIWIKLCSHFPFRFGTSLKVFILSLPFERRGWGCNGGQPLVNWVLTSLFFKHTSILK